MWPLFLGFRPFDWKTLVKSINQMVWSPKAKDTRTFMNVVRFDKKSISNGRLKAVTQSEDNLTAFWQAVLTILCYFCTAFLSSNITFCCVKLIYVGGTWKNALDMGPIVYFIVCTSVPLLASYLFALHVCTFNNNYGQPNSF